MAHLKKYITILPLDNANADITDEDSGDKKFVTLNNLPGLIYTIISHINQCYFLMSVVILYFSI